MLWLRIHQNDVVPCGSDSATMVLWKLKAFMGEVGGRLAFFYFYTCDSEPEQQETAAFFYLEPKCCGVMVNIFTVKCLGSLISSPLLRKI
jgi:hypothetical protein